MYNDLNGTASAAMIILSLGVILFSLILSLISIISYWKIFVKAGKPGWAALVPVYNYVVMTQIAKLPIWYVVLFIIPGANVFALFMVNIGIAKKFGKTTGFGVGMALLPIIFIPLLAFSDNVYEDDTIVDNNNNNTFDATNVINGNNETTANVNMSAPFNNVIENIQVESNNTVVEATPETNNVVEPVQSLENTVSDINVEEQVNLNNNEIPTMVENQNNFNENVNIFEPQVENVTDNPIIEPVQASQEVITSEVVTNVPLVEEQTNVINAFNSTPIITDNEPINNIGVTDSIEGVNNLQQTDNVANTIEEVNPQVVTEIPLANENVEQKKICKNCGNELPNIVSICPSCGTDNE